LEAAEDEKVADMRSQIEKGVLEHSSFLLDLDAYSFVVIILELFPKLCKQVIKQFESVGGPDGSKAEFIYLNQILSCLGKEADSEQAEVI
jgi:hypothetical protein